MRLWYFISSGIFAASLSSVLYASDEPFIELDSSLEPGRQIWLGTCASCHGYGIAGAPVPMRTRDWLTRVEKSKSELYGHAVNGFFGPGDTYMPPKGGNDNLSNADIEQAVDYMLALAIYYIEKEEAKK